MKTDYTVPVCPYCLSPLFGVIGDCPSVCGRRHHIECWEANSGCTTLGCPANPEPRRPDGAPRPGFVIPDLVNVCQRQHDGTISKVVTTRANRRIAKAAIWTVSTLVIIGAVILGSMQSLNTRPNQFMPTPLPRATMTLAGQGGPGPILVPTNVPAPSSDNEDPTSGPAIKKGSLVEITSPGLNVRAAPGLQVPTITSLLRPYRMLIVDGPVNVEGTDWWQTVWNSSGATGWSSGRYLNSIQLPEEGPVVIGSLAKITSPGLKVRDQAGLNSAVLTSVNAPYHMLVVGGPLLADEIEWWQVVWDSSGRRGWSSGNYLQSVARLP
jgi:hypothetical protein